MSYTTSIAQQTATPGSGFFTGGATSGTNYASFGTTYDAINGSGSQSAGSTYTVQSGDTLQSIAQAVWGDSSFWYLIADANGLTASSTLQAGQTLSIPDKIANANNNASTNTVYNPNTATGDVSPTHPPAPAKHHGCGGFGAILLDIIAIAVAAVTLDPLVAELGPVLGGAAAGVAGSVVSQSVGLATGIQSKFSWAGVGNAGTLTSFPK